jgi:methylglutaconyl-CoA hydratase
MSFLRHHDGPIARLTLNRSEKHNAFDDELIRDLTACLNDLARNEDVRVLILAAEGKSFSAGADLDWMRRMAGFTPAENLADAEALAGLMARLNSMPIPVIARVHGPAIGGGVGLVACCDIAIATPAAFFQLSEVRLGLIPATIGPYVIAAIGARAARRFFVTAEKIPATEAKRLHLVHDVVEDTDLDGTITALIDAILAGGTVAVRAAKSLVLDYADCGAKNVMADSAARIANLRIGAEAQGRLRNFLDRDRR